MSVVKKIEKFGYEREQRSKQQDITDFCISREKNSCSYRKSAFFFFCIFSLEASTAFVKSTV